MKKTMTIIMMASCLLAFRFHPGNNKTPAMKSAIEKSLDLLLKSSHEFSVNAGCPSCHGQDMGAVVFSLARQNGFSINDSLFHDAVESITSGWRSRQSALVQHEDQPGLNLSAGYALWGLTEIDYKPCKMTSTMIYQLMERQTQDGHWGGDNGRPPMEYYSFSSTALVIKAIQFYAPSAYSDKVLSLKEKAKTWLSTAPATNNEEKVFQLLGLKWVQADQSLINRQAAMLMSRQQADGGWSQLDSLKTDSYATGQCLYALNQSGALEVSDPVYKKGIDFLLRTQYPDGSWKVQSRSHPVVPYVYSGFPHGENQFISAAGTNWATMALLLAWKEENK